ncbi:MAG: HNH endonuclease [Nanoarchaeota archaeon]
MNKKICPKCKVIKPFYEFSKDRIHKDGLFRICKKCDSLKHKQYHQKNKEKLNKKTQQWRKKHPEYNKQYYLKNIQYYKQWEKGHYQKRQIQHKLWYQINLDKVKIQKKQYRQKNEEKIKEIYRNDRNRRRLLYKQKTDITTQWLINLKRNTPYCALCNVKLVENGHHPNARHLDHIIPLNKQCKGTHTMNNVRFICRTCNLSRPKNGKDYVFQETGAARG